MKTKIRWHQKDGFWRSRCGRFAIEQEGGRSRLHDITRASGLAYTADSVKEAKQLAKRIADK